MPHRTVFQVGKNHVHPFTMFLGGVIVGSVAAGTIAWVWAERDSTVQDITPVTTKKAANPAPAVSATPTPTVSF